MKTCEHEGCTNLIGKSAKRFCSLACANRQFNLVKSRKAKPLRTCDNPTCSHTFELVDSRQRFCSRSCSASVNNKRYKKRTTTLWHQCPKCHKQVYKTKYCSTFCRHAHEIELWVAGEIDGSTAYGIATFVRRYLNGRSGGRCEGIDEQSGQRCIEDRIVQVDHINGDPSDSSSGNVRHLCPTCHALTPTFAGRQKNTSSRMWKQKYPNYRQNR